MPSKALKGSQEISMPEEISSAKPFTPASRLPVVAVRHGNGQLAKSRGRGETVARPILVCEILAKLLSQSQNHRQRLRVERFLGDPEGRAQKDDLAFEDQLGANRRMADGKDYDDIDFEM